MFGSAAFFRYLNTEGLKYFVILEGTNNIAAQYLSFADATKCSVLTL
jgi:hypothetical protein